MLNEGRWTQERYRFDPDGRFQRRPTTFRGQIEDHPDARHPAHLDRYHLYVSLACPWAHRVLIVRALRGLTEQLPISVVHSHMGERGWTFDPGPGVIPDPVLKAACLHELYTAADPRFTGNVTVPVLWDLEAGTIVNNESREIIRQLNTRIPGLSGPDLAPADRLDAIDAVLDDIYEPINNGVYRAGFAEGQAAYEEAIEQLFAALERYDTVLGERRWLVGDGITEADICLFTTLIRFDSVYHTHFKCNRRSLADHPNLWAYVREIYQLPGVAATVDLDYTRAHYYGSHRRLNPLGIVAVGPRLDLWAPPDRGHLR